MSSAIGLLILILDIFAVIKIIQSSAAGMEKLLWILGVIFFPIIGLIVWYFAGPGGKKSSFQQYFINSIFTFNNILKVNNHAR